LRTHDTQQKHASTSNCLGKDQPVTHHSLIFPLDHGLFSKHLSWKSCTAKEEKKIPNVSSVTSALLKYQSGLLGEKMEKFC